MLGIIHLSVPLHRTTQAAAGDPATRVNVAYSNREPATAINVAYHYDTTNQTVQYDYI